MLRLMRTQLYTMLHSKSCLLLLGVCLVFCWVLGNDGGLDAYRDLQAMNRKIMELEERGLDGLRHIQTYHDLEGVEDREELLSILKKRQIVMPPTMAAGGMLLLIFLLPGAALTPGLSKTRGIGRELQYGGKGKALLSRMLLSWAFCVLISSALYLLAVRNWTDPGAAAPGQLLRNWFVTQLYVLAGLGYSYFMSVLFRHTAVAAAVMIGIEMVDNRIIPGLRLFYPFFMIPDYNGSAYRNTAALTAAGCTPETFIRYCAVCLAYAVICTFLAFRLFRRREVL